LIFDAFEVDANPKVQKLVFFHTEVIKTFPGNGLCSKQPDSVKFATAYLVFPINKNNLYQKFHIFYSF